jgi:hypothetical protein
MTLYCRYFYEDTPYVPCDFRLLNPFQSFLHSQALRFLLKKLQSFNYFYSDLTESLQLRAKLQAAEGKLQKTSADLVEALASMETLKARVVQIESKKASSSPVMPHVAKGHRREGSSSDHVLAKITADYMAAQSTITALNLGHLYYLCLTES